MRYKIGDKVVIRDDLKTGTCGNDTVIEQMLKEAGKTFKIVDYLNNEKYRLEKVGNNWNDDMIDHEKTAKLTEPMTSTPSFMKNAKEVDNYASLKRVLNMAVEQAENGKGKERHANDEPFEKQKICALNRQIGSNHGLIYQACKKAIESDRLPKERAIAEMLGAINYLAAAIILKEEE